MNELRYRFHRLFSRERIVMAIVWRLPRSVAYWAAIRVGAHATTGQYGSQEAPALYFMDALKRWDDE